MSNKYQSGSLWRRWDLHIHTPVSILHNKFEGADINKKWENYFAHLEEIEDISVIGVTDYYS